MKQQIQQPGPALQPTAAKRQLILKYHQARARGTQDVTHQYQSAFFPGIDVYALEQGYKRLESHLACVEVWDRGIDDKKRQKNDRFLVVIHIESCELVYILENIELFEHFCHDVLLVLPILPEVLYSQHGIKC